MKKKKTSGGIPIKKIINIILETKPIDGQSKLYQKYISLVFYSVWSIGTLILAYSMSLRLSILEAETISIGAILGSLFLIWIFFGFLCSFPFFKKFIGAIKKFISFGYEMGDQFKSTDITVTHQYGSTYKATARESSKGFLGAIIAFFIGLYLYLCLFGYAGPIIIIKKITLLSKQITDYKNQIQDNNV